MTTLNDRQYERVAQWLDGEPVELDAAERAAADEIRAQEQRLASALSSDVPSAAIDRAKKRILAATAKSYAAMWRIGAVAAAAAVIVVAISVWQEAGAPTGPGPDIATPTAVDDGEIFSVIETMGELDEYNLVEEELAFLEESLSNTTESNQLSEELDELEEAIENFEFENDPDILQG